MKHRRHNYTQEQRDFLLALPSHVDKSVYNTQRWRELFGDRKHTAVMLYRYRLRSNLNIANRTTRKENTNGTQAEPRTTAGREGAHQQVATRVTSITPRHINFCPHCGEALAALEAVAEARAQAGPLRPRQRHA